MSNKFKPTNWEGMKSVTDVKARRKAESLMKEFEQSIHRLIMPYGQWLQMREIAIALNLRLP